MRKHGLYEGKGRQIGDNNAHELICRLACLTQFVDRTKFDFPLYLDVG